MHAPITYSEPGGRRSLLEERPMRPPIIGKIRPGIKVLTRAARDKPEAVRIHDAGLARGEVVLGGVEERVPLDRVLQRVLPERGNPLGPILAVEDYRVTLCDTVL